MIERAFITVFILGACLLHVPGFAQPAGFMDEVYDKVGLDQRLGEVIPGNVLFTNEKGEQVELGQFFDGEKPVLLTFVYHNCPMLCNTLLDGFTRALEGVEGKPGVDFEVLTISFETNEGWQLAAQQKEIYLEKLGRPEAADGWHFLTGSAESIHTITDAIGFQYAWFEEIEQYIHPAVLTVASGDRVISRYFQGVTFDPDDVRLSLVEASNGSIGDPIELVALYCMKFDSSANSYVLQAQVLMKLGGGLTVLLLGLALFIFWRREGGRSRHALIDK